MRREEGRSSVLHGKVADDVEVAEGKHEEEIARRALGFSIKQEREPPSTCTSRGIATCNIPPEIALKPPRSGHRACSPPRHTSIGLVSFEAKYFSLLK